MFVYPQWQIADQALCWWLPLAAVLLVSIVLLRRGLCSPAASWSRTLLFAWLNFCVALVPVLGLSDVGFMKYSLVADHYQQLALISVTALTAAGYLAWQAGVAGRCDRFLSLSPGWRSAPVCCSPQGKLASTQTPSPCTTPLWQPIPTAGSCTIIWELNSTDPAMSTMPCQYQKAVALQPDFSEAHNNLGNALLNTGRSAEAIEQYREALLSQPDYVEAYNGLGAALLAAGRPQEAVEQYQQALRLKPDYAEVSNNLAAAYVQLQRPADAIAAAERGVALARAHGQTALAEQLDNWLKSYRATQANTRQERHPARGNTTKSP